MHKSYWIILLLFIVRAGTAQVCDFPLPPSNICQDAPLLCNLDGYCSNNGAATNSGTPNAFCGQVENNNWVSFIAGSTEFELQVTVENCNNGSGLQVQFFATSDCQNFTAVSNCLNPAFGVENVTASNLEIGQVYYLMMDGKGGDVCDYSYVVLSGLILSPAEATVEVPDYLCGDNTVALDGSASASGTGVTYEWSTMNGAIIGNPTEAIVETDTPGTYLLSVLDEGGCADSMSVQVLESPLAQIDIDEPDVLDCLLNTTVTLSGTEATGLPQIEYAWSTQNGNIISGGMTQNPVVDEAGIYTLVITNGITGCTEEASVEVTASQQTPVSNAGTDQELNCLALEVSLDGSASSTGGSFLYEWTTTNGNIVSGANTNEANVDAPGDYTLIVTNAFNGCISEDVVQVIENPAIPESAVFQIKNPCYGEEFGKILIDSVIGGTAPFMFAIDSSLFGITDTFERLAEGEYQISIQDETGCEWDTIIQMIPQPELIVKLAGDTSLVLGCPYEIEAIVNIPSEQVDTLIWNSDANCQGCFVQRDTLLYRTEYTVTLIDENGCIASANKWVRVQKERFVFIPNVFSPNDDGVNDLFLIHGGKDVAIIKSLGIYSRWGDNLFYRENFQPNDLNASWDGLLKGREAPEGVYIYFAEIEFIDGRSAMYKGDISLVR